MPLTVDFGRRLVRVEGVPRVVEVIATRATDPRPARCGFKPVREYSSPALGPMREWSRAFPVLPEAQPGQA